MNLFDISCSKNGSGIDYKHVLCSTEVLGIPYCNHHFIDLSVKDIN